MSWQFGFPVNEELFIKEPRDTSLGKRILLSGILLMNELGIEDFTFKKLAVKVGTTEASIYRYFENKTRLLQYYFQWYWKWVDYQIMVASQNINEPFEKLNVICEVLDGSKMVFNTEEEKETIIQLRELILREGNKSFLHKYVDEDNKKYIFKPYKELVGRIAAIFRQINPKFEFPRSLASTMVEMGHLLSFASHHLPSLTDREPIKKPTNAYLMAIIKKALQ